MKTNTKSRFSISKNTKLDNKKEKEKKNKELLEEKNKEKELKYQKLEEYVKESGLDLAFNIIFAELISKQILPENFFTYTSMRLKQIGKEIEGLKTKEEIKVEKTEEELKEEQKDEQKPETKEENNEEAENKLFEGQENKDNTEKKEDENVLLTVQPEKKKTIRKK